MGSGRCPSACPGAPGCLAETSSGSSLPEERPSASGPRAPSAGGAPKPRTSRSADTTWAARSRSAAWADTDSRPRSSTSWRADSRSPTSPGSVTLPAPGPRSPRRPPDRAPPAWAPWAWAPSARVWVPPACSPCREAGPSAQTRIRRRSLRRSRGLRPMRGPVRRSWTASGRGGWPSRPRSPSRAARTTSVRARAAGSVRRRTAGVRDARGTPRRRRSRATAWAWAVLRTMTAIWSQPVAWWMCSPRRIRATWVASWAGLEARTTEGPAGAASVTLAPITGPPGSSTLSSTVSWTARAWRYPVAPTTGTRAACAATASARAGPPRWTVPRTRRAAPRLAPSWADDSRLGVPPRKVSTAVSGLPRTTTWAACPRASGTARVPRRRAVAAVQSW